MEEHIFTNSFNLKYSKKEIQVEFNKVKDKLLKRYIKNITILILMISFAPSTIISYFFQFSDLKSFKMIMCFSYFITFSSLIMTFLTFFSKNLKLMKIINYVNYFFFIIIILNVRYSLVNFAKLDIIVVFFLVWAEVVTRFVFILYEVFTFCELSILNFLSAMFMWAIYFPVGQPNFLQKDLLIDGVNSICLIIVVLFCFISERNRKLAFYYKYKIEKKAQWLDNVLDNMKTGFLSIKGDKITYVNNYLENLLNSWKGKIDNKFDISSQGKTLKN